MEKEFVPYQPSLDMRELGFDEACFGCYGNQNDLWYENPINGILDIPEDNTLAPLYSQAFRWFREKYRLDAIINVGELGYHANIIDRRGKFKQIEITPEVREYVYEEAELACLKKLIEIVKEKK